MAGKIIAIFVAPSKHAGQIEAEAVHIKAARGIVGDRFYGFRRTQPGRNLTLIEWEAIEEFNRAYKVKIALNATRRNLITQGIRLNDLVGKQFQIGEALCQGIEPCEPCRLMARDLIHISLSQNQIINAFTRKAGIRAAVLSDGIVKTGDVVKMVSY